MDLTKQQRQAIRRVLIDFKKFWNANTGTPIEAVKADKLIDSIIELAKATEEL